MRIIVFFSGAVSSFMLSGCGTHVPLISEPWEGVSPNAPELSPTGGLEFNVKQKIYCELIDAVKTNQKVLPKNWSAEVTIDLQVDETGALNPGISFVRPLTSMTSISYGLGATLSSQGTKEDKSGSYWNLDSFRGPKTKTTCPDHPVSGSSPLLESDLNISSFLYDHLAAEVVIPPSVVSKNAGQDLRTDFFSYHAKFIVITSGTASPVYKLTRIVTGNGMSPLASANRTRTHDLLITFGPSFKPGSANIAISSHAAQDIGIEVSNGNRASISSALIAQ